MDVREILFRGKRTDNGEWVYGNYYKAEFINGEGYEHFIIEVEAEGEQYLVVPETVGQYIGLKDKNGKKIFEGDLVSTDLYRPYLIVTFRNGSFMFNCNDGGKDYFDFMSPSWEEVHDEDSFSEVIGNIHDNPELLKKNY